jgi:hypothetical protein
MRHAERYREVDLFSSVFCWPPWCLLLKVLSFRDLLLVDIYCYCFFPSSHLNEIVTYIHMRYHSVQFIDWNQELQYGCCLIFTEPAIIVQLDSVLHQLTLNSTISLLLKILVCHFKREDAYAQLK